MTRHLPVWKQIKAHLAAQIRDGSLPPGAQLPTQSDLAERYGTARHGVRRALEALRSEGLVTGWQGRGYFVRAQTWRYPICAQTRLASSLRATGAEVSVRLLRQGMRLPPDPVVSSWLGTTPQRRLPSGEILHLVAAQPLAIGRHFFHPERSAGMLELFTQSLSAPQSFAQIGVPDYARSQTMIRTRLPVADESVTLDVPPQQPVFELWGCNVTPCGAPIEVTQAIVRGDRIHLAVDTPNSAFGAKDL